jgi:ATP-dependent helicase Lhr and Lhr-like helicase
MASDDPPDVSPDAPGGDPLGVFSEPVRTWFETTFRSPTVAQARGWPAISGGEHSLLLAPTGSGKTLAAFLWAIDRLTSTPPPPKERRLRVVYVSPLRALAVDVDRNLRAPLEGIRLAAERLGHDVHRPEVAIRTGDTPAQDRTRMRRNPPDILITTPESLYLMLTSQAREILRGVEAVIIDEIHAMAPTKRGSHLALTLERLEHEVRHGEADGGEAEGGETDGGEAPGGQATPATETDEPRGPQRIALSATQRPLDELARFLGGYDDTGRPRPVTIVDAGITKALELEVMVPVPDMAELGQEVPGHGLDDTRSLLDGPASAEPPRRSIWPAVHPRLLDLVLDHRSTLIFVNARRLAERLAGKLNELHAERLLEAELRERGLDGQDLIAAMEDLGGGAVGGDDVPGWPPPELVKAHHGSLSRERRLQIEDELKAGKLRGLVATSSLELGIDMGAVDLVIQVSSPGAVSRGLQRIGRAGHSVGEPSRGVLVPKFRGDLVETAVVARRMHDGDIESMRYPRNPLDVLAQHLVALSAMDTWEVDDLARLVRRAAPFHDLTDEVLHAVLDLLAGRYPSDEFAELRPRLVWDRLAGAGGGTVRGRSGAQRLAVTNPGTIPDRGLYGVFLPDGTRVGELDEEMVFESRPGESFLLGASTWRIDDITHDRVVVTPAPGEPGKLPFWHGDGPGRPYELGHAIGTFQREVLSNAEVDRDAEVARLQATNDLDPWAADNLVAYLEEQRAVAGAVPDDRTVVVERFRDELGDWRVCILTPFGSKVTAPWAMAIERRLTSAGYDPEIMWTDDGIVLRLPEVEGDLDLGPGGGGVSVVQELTIDPEDVEELVVDQLAGTALFTSTFREAAGRALLLPRRMPGKRTALWQQRQRAANLLQVAARHPTFPILLEATRECLQDVFDVPALKELLTDLRARRIRVVEVETTSASPFAQSLLFGWIGQYMYDYDAPLAERRAAALSLDRDLLRELLGGDELRDLLDADVLAELERELQLLPPLEPDGDAEVEFDRRARDADELHDVLRRLGDLTPEELADRSVDDPGPWVRQLVDERRAIEVRIADQDRIAAAEDAARLRDGLGVSLPPGLPQAFTEPVEDPLGDLVGRYARTHGPFTTDACARRLGAPRERVNATLRWLAGQDRVLEGEFRPGGTHREWVDAEVLQRLKRRSLAALRAEVEPVDAATFGRFLPAWQQVRAATGITNRRGTDALLETVATLQGLPIPASVLEHEVLPARLEGYRPADLDELLAAGEVVWLGVEPLGSADGRVVLCFRDQVANLAPPPVGERPEGETHDAIRRHLAERGASFWTDLQIATGVADQGEVLAALWDLVWAGEVTNDTYAPVRGLLRGPARATSTSRGRRRPSRLHRSGPPAAQGRWSATSTLLLPAPDPTERAHTLAQQLLERHGVLTREAVRAEGVAGGFSAVYPVLKAMEEAGRIRRGYAIAGLGAAQFAAPGAIDRLRGGRSRGPEGESGRDPQVVRLAATDPAQPYGAALPWPESAGRPARVAGAAVVLVDGVPAIYLERGGRSLLTFAPAVDPAAWLPALVDEVVAGRRRKLELTRIDGVDVHDHPLRAALIDAGFLVGHRGLTLRA